LKIYFLDNPDIDPKNVGLVNFTVVDLNRLGWSFNLHKIKTFNVSDYRLQSMVDLPLMNVYEVTPWTETRVRRRLDVPASGAAFFFAPDCKAEAYARYSLNGIPLSERAKGQSFIPLPDLRMPPTVELVCDGGGRPVPDMSATRMVGWYDPIQVDFGADAIYPDAFYFPGGLTNQMNTAYRYATESIWMRFPARQSEDTFTTLSLSMEVIGSNDEESVHVFVRPRGQELREVKVAMHAVWFPLPVLAREGRWSGFQDVEIITRPPVRIKIDSLRAESSRTTVSHQVETDTVAIAVIGRIAPAEIGEGPFKWSADVNGVPGLKGMAFDDPCRTLNELSWPIEVLPGTRDYTVTFHNAGVLDLRWLDIGKSLVIHPDEDSNALMTEGFHHVEGSGTNAFAWTKEKSIVKVPVIPGAAGCRLQLRAQNGHPTQARTATALFNGVTRSFKLPSGPSVVTLDFPAPTRETSGLADLVFQVKAWKPSEEAGTPDIRELGFQFYGLEWENMRTP
ncbi:MAG: hypothetical protein V2A34_16230, partial [Lentisphaerota bacterium]